jgi:hypothetical protein
MCAAHVVTHSEGKKADVLDPGIFAQALTICPKRKSGLRLRPGKDSRLDFRRGYFFIN